MKNVIDGFNERRWAVAIARYEKLKSFRPTTEKFAKYIDEQLSLIEKRYPNARLSRDLGENA